jgi:hypothetical protein
MRQCSRHRRRFIIGIVVAAFFTGESLAQEKKDWRDRFYAEAPKRWEDYLRFARTLQITVAVNIYDGVNRSPNGSILTELKQARGACLCAVYRNLPPLHVPPGKRVPQRVLARRTSSEAEGINSSYSFKLNRRSPDKGWIITDVQLPDQSNTFSDKQREFQESHLKDVCPCLRLENLWLPTLIQDPDFKITAIQTQEIDGHAAVRFDFDYPKADKDYPGNGGFRIKGGWMVLDPEHDWILREYIGHSGSDYTHHKTFLIREGADRHPIVTHSTNQIVGKGEELLETNESEWQTVEQSDVPLEEFTLSAFGLPEPPGTQVGKSRLHLWIALSGMVCLGIAALIRWQLRRTRMAG